MPLGRRLLFPLSYERAYSSFCYLSIEQDVVGSMMGQHKVSFTIKDAEGFFQEMVEPQYEAFLEKNSSVRNALLAIMVAYHMFEWAYGVSFTEKHPEEFGESGEPEVIGCLELARRITNGTKHFKNTGVGTRVQSGFSSAFSDAFARPLMVESDEMPGGEISVDSLLDCLVGFWKKQYKGKREQPS